MLEKKILKIVSICILFVMIITTTNRVCADDQDEEEVSEQEREEITIESSTVPTNEPVIDSQSAVIYDRQTGQVLWGKGQDERRAMASTTKIMTAIIVLENTNLTDTVIISQKAANTGGSRLKISKNDKITINDLLYGLMLRSGNDAAVALAEYVGGDLEGFANLMNEQAKQLGLVDTNFVTPHGLDNDEHYTTAKELAILTDYALKNEKFANIVNTKIATIYINGIQRKIYNTNELLGNLNGVNGVKTGFTGNAGRCLVTSCTRNNEQIITVVLGAGTKKQRTSDSIKLIEYAFKNYTKINLKEKIEEKFEEWNKINANRIYINKGKKEEVKLQLGEIEKAVYAIKQGEEENIEIAINYITTFSAPLEAGTKVGIIIVSKISKEQKNEYRENEIIETVDIICSKTIEKKGIKEYIEEILSKYMEELI